MKKNVFICLCISVMAFSCKKQIFVPDGSVNGGLASHNIGYPPNYTVVFDDSKVHRIEIVFTAEEWSDMQADLQSKIQGGGGPGGTFSNEDPSYFPADIYYNDLVWENVGVRYKGNSSLRANSGKLPLRFDFDEFEDDFEGIKNQRFYGFKELSLSSNYNDQSLIREKTASDLFRDFGVPAVRTVHYQIYINKGNGPEYYGVYSVCEVISDTFLNDYFGSETGNCYKPEDDGASFATSGFTLDGFELKTNETTANKGDIQQMYNYLHASTRTSNPAQWKADLESVFDVNGFLKYLAVNNTIQNWDTYGRMPHNYYLYNDPKDGLLKWIVWDNNEAFQLGKMGGSLSFAMTEVGTNWPLIKYIIEDSDYLATYKSHIKSFIESTFSTNRMNGIYNSQQSLLQQSANAERSGYSYVNGQFNSGISTMKQHNIDRVAAAATYVQ
ncbi:MAG: CotH kinase family protein [Bacteroidetes bacterium]|nr:CotH kinase family protein [Bacteroidota bacterium]